MIAVHTKSAYEHVHHAMSNTLHDDAAADIDADTANCVGEVAELSCARHDFNRMLLDQQKAFDAELVRFRADARTRLLYEQDAAAAEVLHIQQHAAMQLQACKYAFDAERAIYAKTLQDERAAYMKLQTVNGRLLRMLHLYMSRAAHHTHHEAEKKCQLDSHFELHKLQVEADNAAGMLERVSSTTHRDLVT